MAGVAAPGTPDRDDTRHMAAAMKPWDTSWYPVEWAVQKKPGRRIATKVHLARSRSGRTRCGRIVGNDAHWWGHKNPTRQEACVMCWMNQPTGRILSS